MLCSVLVGLPQGLTADMSGRNRRNRVRRLWNGFGGRSQIVAELTLR